MDTRLRVGGRWRNQAIGAVALVAAWLLMTALGAILGLLVIVLAWVLVRSLSAQLAEGGRRQWLRALRDYAVVVALVLAVMTVAPAPAPPKAEPTPAPAPPKAEPTPAPAPPKAEPTPARRQATAASPDDSWAKLRARWDQLVKRVSAGAPEIKFTDAKEGRR